MNSMSMSRDDFISQMIKELSIIEAGPGLESSRDLNDPEQVLKKMCYDFPEISGNEMIILGNAFIDLIDHKQESNDAEKLNTVFESQEIYRSVQLNADNLQLPHKFFENLIFMTGSLVSCVSSSVNNDKSKNDTKDANNKVDEEGAESPALSFTEGELSSLSATVFLSLPFYLLQRPLIELDSIFPPHEHEHTGESRTVDVTVHTEPNTTDRSESGSAWVNTIKRVVRFLDLIDLSILSAVGYNQLYLLETNQIDSKLRGNCSQLQEHLYNLVQSIDLLSTSERKHCMEENDTNPVTLNASTTLSDALCLISSTRPSTLPGMPQHSNINTTSPSTPDGDNDGVSASADIRSRLILLTTEILARLGPAPIPSYFAFSDDVNVASGRVPRPSLLGCWLPRLLYAMRGRTDVDIKQKSDTNGSDSVSKSQTGVFNVTVDYNLIACVSNTIHKDDLLFLHIFAALCDYAVPSLNEQKPEYLEGLYMFQHAQKQNQQCDWRVWLLQRASSSLHSEASGTGSTWLYNTIIGLLSPLITLSVKLDRHSTAPSPDSDIATKSRIVVDATLVQGITTCVIQRGLQSLPNVRDVCAFTRCAVLLAPTSELHLLWDHYYDHNVSFY